MSERLDRIEALQEQTQLQIDVLVEEVTLMQQEMRTGSQEMRTGFQAIRATFERMQIAMMQTQQQVDSLAKSVQAHCDDTQRHQ
ncbi:MAG: hypothetical protein WA902_11730 [Thermosynechococcaceae cyanobacterium]